MQLAENILSILEHLPARKLDPDGFLSLRELVEKEIVQTISELLDAPDHITIKGRTGQGRVADVPWVGIHDQRIDSAARTGLYVATLFSVEGDGFAFSIQLGTDRFTLPQIEMRVANARRQFPATANYIFTNNNLSLRPKKSGSSFGRSSRPGRYETANVLGKQYSLDTLMDATIDLSADLLALVRIYEGWVSQTLVLDMDEAYQCSHVDLPVDMDFDAPTPRLSREFSSRLGVIAPPRKPQEGAKALWRALYRCEVDPNHRTFITEEGLPYMEKHHLIPMEQYFKYDASIDHWSNIVVLCPTCRRLIRHASTEERHQILKQLYNKRRDLLRKYYDLDLATLLRYYSI